MQIAKDCTTRLSLTASHVGYVWLCLWESWGYGYTYSRGMVLKMPRTTLEESKISWIMSPFVFCKISTRWWVSKSLKYFYRSTDSSWLIHPKYAPHLWTSRRIQDYFPSGCPLWFTHLQDMKGFLQRQGCCSSMQLGTPGFGVFE